MKLKKLLLVLMAVVVLSAITGCAKTTTSGNNSETTKGTEGDTTTVADEIPTTAVGDNVTSEEPTTEEVTTEAPTEIITEAPTEAPTEAFVGAWTLLSTTPLTPQKSGYEELDTLVDQLLAQVVTEDMNGYKKAWACYEYLVDNISYSRGMDANTGMYSSSDPATTPTEVLWATDLLNSGMGCCYHYSSAYVYILRAIGFEAHLVSGNVPAYGGGVTPHCWLYVTIDGKNYIFDPDLDMNYYKRDVNNGIENPAKDRFFCVPTEKMSYFYKAETYHTN